MATPDPLKAAGRSEQFRPAAHGHGHGHHRAVQRPMPLRRESHAAHTPKR